MVDAVTTNVMADDAKYIAHFTNLSDSTGEAAVKKVDLSGLVGPDKAVPSSLAIKRVSWSINGFEYVKIAWDHTDDDTAVILGVGDGDLDFRHLGGLHDPGSTGGTGDILFTAPAGSAGDSYSITLELSKIQ